MLTSNRSLLAQPKSQLHFSEDTLPLKSPDEFPPAALARLSKSQGSSPPLHTSPAPPPFLPNSTLNLPSSHPYPAAPCRPCPPLSSPSVPVRSVPSLSLPLPLPVPPKPHSYPPLPSPSPSIPPLPRPAPPCPFLPLTPASHPNSLPQPAERHECPWI